MPKLVFISDHFAGRVYDLVLEKTTIGRSDGNTLVIHDKEISHVHCEILVYGGEVIVRDLGSANGTFVDEVRLNSQAQIKSGHIVRFGPVRARLELDTLTGPDATTEMTAIHEMGRILRDQRREASQPKPSGVPVTIDPDNADTPAEHTTLLGKSSPPLPRAREAGQPKAPPETPAPNSTVIIVVTGLLVAAAVAAWWIWGRK